ncbi:hypothetical protein D3C78_1610700 [compost metagenome]
MPITTQSTPWVSPPMKGTLPIEATSRLFSWAAAIIGGPATNFTKFASRPALSNSPRSRAASSSQSVFA